MRLQYISTFWQYHELTINHIDNTDLLKVSDWRNSFRYINIKCSHFTPITLILRFLCKWWWIDMDDIWLLSRLYTMWSVLTGPEQPSTEPDTHTRASRAECACVHVKMSSVDARRAHPTLRSANWQWHWTRSYKNQWGESEEKYTRSKIKIHESEKRVKSFDRCEWRP